LKKLKETDLDKFHNMSTAKIEARMDVIERMFMFAQEFDERIVFSAMSRFDQFYARRDLKMVAPNDIHLTTFAAFLLIAEKQNTKAA
jgi:hypothetical protein